MIWYSISKLSPSDIESIKLSFKTANYWWVALSLLFGILNIGHQHFIATGAEGTFLDKAIFGALSVLPILIVSYAVGLATEFTFCVIRNHPISEGYLVTGMLIALVMPPFIPLWQVALATIFAVVIGKEVSQTCGACIACGQSPRCKLSVL